MQELSCCGANHSVLPGHVPSLPRLPDVDNDWLSNLRFMSMPPQARAASVAAAAAAASATAAAAATGAAPDGAAAAAATAAATAAAAAAAAARTPEEERWGASLEEVYHIKSGPSYDPRQPLMTISERHMASCSLPISPAVLHLAQYGPLSADFLEKHARVERRVTGQQAYMEKEQEQEQEQAGEGPSRTRTAH